MSARAFVDALWSKCDRTDNVIVLSPSRYQAYEALVMGAAEPAGYVFLDCAGPTNVGMRVPVLFDEDVEDGLILTRGYIEAKEARRAGRDREVIERTVRQAVK